jgi:hypothetical protein
MSKSEPSKSIEKPTNKESPPLYLFIIWEKSRKKSDDIFNDLGKKFIIRDVYEVSWSKKQFIDNLKRFYGTIETAQEKAKIFGAGAFLLVLVTDPNPKFLEMETPKGLETINSNILASKKLYRKWIGKDFAVHSSISEKESNHNITLFFGKPSKILDRELTKNWDGSIKKLESELTGKNGWKDMKQLLNVLNGMYYVILRNFDSLPDQLNQKDIDILTGNPMMKQIITPDSFNVDEKVIPTRIGDKKIIFDYKNARDHYFDRKWSENILKRRIFHANGFYVPCAEDYFYTLLYHVIFQKPLSFDRYKNKLISLADELSIINPEEEIFYNFDKSKEFLNKYLNKMGYRNTKSFKYKFFHSGVFRYVFTSIYLAKTKGLKFLLSTIKTKIKRKLL